MYYVRTCKANVLRGSLSEISEYVGAQLRNKSDVLWEKIVVELDPYLLLVGLENKSSAYLPPHTC